MAQGCFLEEHRHLFLLILTVHHLCRHIGIYYLGNFQFRNCCFLGNHIFLIFEAEWNDPQHQRRRRDQALLLQISYYFLVHQSMYQTFEVMPLLCCVLFETHGEMDAVDYFLLGREQFVGTRHAPEFY